MTILPQIKLRPMGTIMIQNQLRPVGTTLSQTLLRASMGTPCQPSRPPGQVRQPLSCWFYSSGHLSLLILVEASESPDTSLIPPPIEKGRHVKGGRGEHMHADACPNGQMSFSRAAAQAVCSPHT